MLYIIGKLVEQVATKSIKMNSSYTRSFDFLTWLFECHNVMNWYFAASLNLFLRESNRKLDVVGGEREYESFKSNEVTPTRSRFGLNLDTCLHVIHLVSVPKNFLSQENSYFGSDNLLEYLKAMSWLEGMCYRLDGFCLLY